MPNWCDNVIVIRTKTKSQLKQILTEIGTGHGKERRAISFENIVPEDRTDKNYWQKVWQNDRGIQHCDALIDPKPYMVQHIENSAERNEQDDILVGYAFDWYNWTLDHWNTKWDACDVYLEFCPKDSGSEYPWEANIIFNTAWSPALSVYKALTEKYPYADIHGHYEEPGMGYEGDWYTIDGEFVNDEQEIN